MALKWLVEGLPEFCENNRGSGLVMEGLTATRGEKRSGQYITLTENSVFLSRTHWLRGGLCAENAD